MTTLNKF